jgi:hypothetical protein
MDKSRKTRWEKQMQRWVITLCILLPVLAGLVIWAIARYSHPGR